VGVPLVNALFLSKLWDYHCESILTFYYRTRFLPGENFVSNDCNLALYSVLDRQCRSTSIGVAWSESLFLVTIRTAELTPYSCSDLQPVCRTGLSFSNSTVSVSFLRFTTRQMDFAVSSETSTGYVQRQLPRVQT